MKIEKAIPGLTRQEITLIKSIIGSKYEVFIFGSRATGKHQLFSDVDICLKTPGKISDADLAKLKIAFQESDLPYKVDLIDYSSVSEDFKTLIEKSSVSI